MTDEQWRNFFLICASVLVKATGRDRFNASRCGWTTFDTLEHHIHYWNDCLPNAEDLREGHVAEGAWSQHFLYDTLAHVIIPRSFAWETGKKDDYAYHTTTQDIDRLSVELSKAGIAHRKTELVLEIKLY